MTSNYTSSTTSTSIQVNRLKDVQQERSNEVHKSTVVASTSVVQRYWNFVPNLSILSIKYLKVVSMISPLPVFDLEHKANLILRPLNQCNDCTSLKPLYKG
jgi:hypothetical protein